jgi:protease IV
MTSLRRLAPMALLAALFTVGCEGRPRPEGKAGEAQKRRGPAVAVLDLSGGVPEEETPSLFGPIGRPKSFDELLRVVREIEDDKQTVAVLVKLGSTNLGAARAQEIGERLALLGEKKKVTCHADGLSNTTMMAAARGCKSLWLSPAGDVETVGLAAQVVYMRRLLADELNLSIDILQVGKFKGAEEPLTRDGPSPEARQSLTSVLSSMRTAWIDSFGDRRRPDLGDIVEDGPYSPARAKSVGLIDEVGYADQALEEAKTASNAVRDMVVFGQGAEDRPGDLGGLLKALAGEGAGTGPIALIRATGSISMGGGGGILGGRGGIVEKDFNKIVTRLEKDDDVKAVVIRVDSPGGSALASDLMWHNLMKLRKKKPVVFSVGDMAASGGYYMACTADLIFAEPMSIVGSIGVVGGKIAVGDALEKIGVHAETFPANPGKPGAAARAAYASPLTKWDDATRARMLESMTAIYELFLARVAEGRSTRGRTVTREKVAESAEGRIFSGLQAKERGLVDEIGGLEAAIAKARELAGEPPDAAVSVVGGKPGFLDALDPSGAQERVRASARPSPLALLDGLAPELVPFVSSLAPLAEGERAVVAVPFAITVR